jgi:signal peptidase complex subunit 1
MEWRNLNFGEKLLHFLLPLSALFAVGALYLTSSCRSMLGIYGLGVVITMFIAVPDWPYFNRNPLSWHQPLGIDGLTTPTPSQASMPRMQPHMKIEVTYKS